MTIKTSKGKAFDANWAWATDEPAQLRIEIKDTRPLADIADDFDGLDRIERESLEEGNAVYYGYVILISIIRNPNKGTVQMILAKL